MIYRFFTINQINQSRKITACSFFPRLKDIYVTNNKPSLKYQYNSLICQGPEPFIQRCLSYSYGHL